MPGNAYVFADAFLVPCNAETAYRYISRVEEYRRWWGDVYKEVTKLNDVPEGEPGARHRVKIAGFLPYTLQLQSEATRIDKPHRIEFKTQGDLEGNGIWTFRTIDGGTEVTFDWRIVANKAVIRWFSFLLKPLFRANHAYCVRKAAEGIRKDLSPGQTFPASTSLNSTTHEK